MERRVQLHLMVPAEVKIDNAMVSVKLLGADEKLTEAVTLLKKAKNLVADYVDENNDKLTKWQ